MHYQHDKRNDRLTARQEQIMRFIQENNPTHSEIASKLGILRSSVICHLDALERKGYIQRESRKRGIICLLELINTVK